MKTKNIPGKNNFHFIRFSFISAAVLLVLSFLVNKDIFRTFDYQALVSLQAAFGRFVDLPFSILTLFGSSEVTVAISGLLFLWLLWKYKRFFFGIFLIFSIYIFEMAGKFYIFHPKPPVIFNRYVLNIFFPSSFIVDTNFSYPSGHMARSTFLTVVILAFLLSGIVNKSKRILVVSLGVLFISAMFISRIYLGEHWFSDVLGGALLGASIGSMALYFR